MSEIYSTKGDGNLNNVEKIDKFTNWVYSEIKPHLKGRILEIGSGIGTYSKKISNDFKPNGKVFTDIDLEYVSQLKSTFKSDSTVSIQQLDLTFPDFSIFEKNSFDSAFALNVLEHIEDDMSALNNVYHMLKHHGLFVLLVPAHKFLYNCIDRDIGHFRRYSEKEMLEKISRTKFKLRKLHYFNFLSILGWYIHGNILKKSLVDEKALGFLNKIVPFLKFLEKNILRKKIGISLIVVLEKE